MSAKRLFDLVLSSLALLIAIPVLLVVASAIFLYDFGSPLYIASRVGRGGRLFRMIKFRSMIVNADRTGATSTSATDSRVTPVGQFVRQFKLDELVQLWNVLLGDMSLVGPRPNVPSGVAVYTPVEMRLLDVLPGITDFASIVFADEGEILRSHTDPDAAYNQLIRPWKSRLGLFYVDNRSIWVDLQLIALTIAGIASRTAALKGVHRLMLRLRAPAELADVALRREALVPQSPPGLDRMAASKS
jgi:lipopolysaccharide/colanic/teichoic acid biosynthesis glycosyltransferase